MNASRRSLMFGAVAAAFGIGTAGVYVAAESAQSKEKVIKITAKRFEYAPNHITVKKGVPLVFELRTLDIVMGFNLPDFNVRTDIVPGKVSRLRLVPDKTGTFIFLCDIFCGSGHEEMNGRIIVVE